MKEEISEVCFCKNEKHNFILLSDTISWCSICGTIKKEDVNDEYVILGSHYLYPKIFSK